MKKQILSLAALLVIGFSTPCLATGWSTVVVSDVRVVQTTTGKRICIISVVGGTQYGFEIAASADEKMVDLASKAVELKTNCYILNDHFVFLPRFTPRLDTSPYYNPNVVDMSSFVLAKP